MWRVLAVLLCYVMSVVPAFAIPGSPVGSGGTWSSPVRKGASVSAPASNPSLDNTTSPVTITTLWDVLGMLTAIPRWKIYQRPDNAAVLTLVHGESNGTGAVWRSTNSGGSWATLGTQVVQDYHASIDGDTAGRIFIGVPVGWDGTPDSPGVLRRYNGSAWNADVAFNDYAGIYSNVNILRGNGSDVWAFVRSGSGSASGVTYWHRSTDNGATFGGATAILDTGDTNLKRVGGLMLSGQPAAMVSYNSGSTYRYCLFRWDGSAFTRIANDNVDATTNNQYNRQYAINQTTSDNVVHIVYHDEPTTNNFSLRYRSRSLSGSWSAASTIQTLTGATDGEMALAVKGQYLLLVYVDTRSAVKGVYARWKRSTDTSWSAELRVDNGGGVGNVNTARDLSGSFWPIVYDRNHGGGQIDIMFKSIGLTDFN